jgi:hypothetical protein
MIYFGVIYTRVLKLCGRSSKTKRIRLHPEEINSDTPHPDIIGLNFYFIQKGVVLGF